MAIPQVLELPAALPRSIQGICILKTKSSVSNPQWAEFSVHILFQSWGFFFLIEIIFCTLFNVLPLTRLSVMFEKQGQPGRFHVDRLCGPSLKIF